MRCIGDNVSNTVGRKKSSTLSSLACKNDFLKWSICCLIRLFLIAVMIKLLIGLCNALNSTRIELSLGLIIGVSNCNLYIN